MYSSDHSSPSIFCTLWCCLNEDYLQTQHSSLLFQVKQLATDGPSHVLRDKHLCKCLQMWDPNLENNVNPRYHFVYECQSWRITESPRRKSVFQDAYSTKVLSHSLSQASSLYAPEQSQSTMQLKSSAAIGWMCFANRNGS